MIRRIEIANFMSHARTVIEPADGLTVLIGPNNCGKSAVVAALQILCHNETSTHVMRHGEHECTVTVETVEGDTVQWRRRKSPAYLVNGQELSRLERSELPEEVSKILRLGKVAGESGQEFDVHFGEQKSPVFLLDKPGSHAAQFFASSSDAASLVEMQKLHQQRLSEAKRERARLEVEAQRLRRDLVMLAEADPLGHAINEAEQEHAALEEGSRAVDSIKLDIQRLKEHGFTLDGHEEAADILAPVRPPPSLDAPEPLSHVGKALTRSAEEVERQTARAEALMPVRPVPALDDADALQRQLAALSTTDHVASRLESQCRAVSMLAVPPAFDDAAVLERLVHDLRLTNHDVLNASERMGVLDILADPPGLTSHSELSSHMEWLRRAEEAHDKSEAASRRLEKLSMPPSLEHSDVLEDFVAGMRQAQEAVISQDQALIRVTVHLSEAELSLRAWAQEHRVCPACGGPLDPARVAEHAKMHGVRGA